MSDPITPGSSTTEYKLTKAQLLLATGVIVLGALISVLTAFQALPGMAAVAWIGPALTLLGVVKSLLAGFSYTQSRTAIKTAAISTEQAVADLNKA